MQQIQHECSDPLAILHRCAHPLGERRPRLRATCRATAGVCTVFGDDQRPRFRQIKHLPGDMAGRRGRRQRFAAPSAGLRIMVNGGIGLFDPAERLARMAFLTAGLLA